MSCDEAIEQAGRIVELRNALSQRSRPQIEVGISTAFGCTIQGEVSKAGVFSSDQFLRVSDALALAGGLTRFAKRNEITLTRKDPKSGEVRHIPLDYESLASGKRPDMNIIVMSGDTIWVP